MTTLYLDLETIPSSDRSVVEDRVKPPATLKKKESIEKWISEEREQAVLDALAKTSFDGAYGQIVCIGYAINDAPAVAVCHGDEAKHLTDLFAAISAETALSGYRERIELVVVGHNIAGFDLPFLRKRALVNRIRPPVALSAVFKARPWDNSIQDTMLLWDSNREARISLDRLCGVLGVESSKGDLDGSQVAAAFAAGEFDRIATYCAADVEAVRACHKRLTWT